MSEEDGLASDMRAAPPTYRCSSGLVDNDLGRYDFASFSSKALLISNHAPNSQVVVGYNASVPAKSLFGGWSTSLDFDEITNMWLVNDQRFYSFLHDNAGYNHILTSPHVLSSISPIIAQYKSLRRSEDPFQRRGLDDSWACGSWSANVLALNTECRDQEWELSPLNVISNPNYVRNTHQLSDSLSEWMWSTVTCTYVGNTMAGRYQINIEGTQAKNFADFLDIYYNSDSIVHFELANSP
jgi:hypothetical protein